MGAVVARRLDGGRERQGALEFEAETIDALKYVAELYKTMIPGTIAWNDSGNNKAYAAGEIGLTFNGVSIYYVLKNSPDPKLKAMAEDTMHQAMPRGHGQAQPDVGGGR